MPGGGGEGEQGSEPDAGPEGEAVEGEQTEEEAPEEHVEQKPKQVWMDFEDFCKCFK